MKLWSSPRPAIDLNMAGAGDAEPGLDDYAAGALPFTKSCLLAQPLRHKKIMRRCGAGLLAAMICEHIIFKQQNLKI